MKKTKSADGLSGGESVASLGEATRAAGATGATGATGASSTSETSASALGTAHGSAAAPELRRTPPPLPILAPVADTSPAMEEAAAYLAAHLSRAASGLRRVVLFGDFDVDGTSSAAILYLFSKIVGVRDVVPYVSRRKEGYGLTKGAISRLLGETPDPAATLIVMMDLGVSSTAECEELLRAGCSTMVIDHHVPKPRARVEWAALRRKYGEDRVHVYDPLLCDGKVDREFSCLSAAGLVFKLCFRILEGDLSGLGTAAMSTEKVHVSAAGRPQSLETVIASMAKICAIAQAADCMPFAVGGHLSSAWHLAKEFERPSPLMAGVKVLYEKTNTASRIGWVIGPIINAAGRLEDAYAAFELLIETSEEEARKKLSKMEDVRRKVQLMTKSAQVSFEDSVLTSKGVAVLVADPSEIKSGVVGIAAARAADHFKAPALYLSQEYSSEHGVIFKGSMRRGPTTFSCEQWILSLTEAGIAYAGGGHPAAAGVSVTEAQLEALVLSAERQSYELDLPPHYDISVEAALDYAEKVTETMPFGRGHESAILNVKGLLTSVRPLTTSRTGTDVIWTYILTVADLESAMPLEIKAMASEIDEKTTELFGSLSGKSLSIPVEVKALVHDNYRSTSRYARAELRVLASAEGVLPGETGSGKKALFRFLSKSEFEKLGGDREGAEKGGTPESPEFRESPEFPDSPDSPDSSEASNTSVASITGSDAAGTPPVSAAGGLAAGPPDYAAVAASAGQAALTLHVDWSEGLHRRQFMLRKPARAVLEETLGLFGADELSALHGGRWSDRLRCYLISPGVVERLIGDKSQRWNFVFSARAQRQWSELKAELDEVDVKKADTRPFDIPFFRPGGRIRPMGFQYADVRLYMERRVALCNNDMGTGKSFISGVWASLRHVGAALDESRMPYVPEGAVRRPVLFVLLKSVLGQFAAEMEEIFDVKVARVTTKSVREMLLSGDGPKGKESSKSARRSGARGRLVGGGEAAGTAGLADSVEQEDSLDSEDSGDDRRLKPIFKVSSEMQSRFAEEVMGGRPFVAVTYDCLARNPWIVSSYEWGGVVIDEAHELKSMSAHKTKAILGPEIDGAPLRRGEFSSPILAMTGTFAKNRPSDWFCWVRMTGADGGIYTDGRASAAQVKFDMRFDGLRFTKIRVRGGRERTITERGQPEHGDELKLLLSPFVVRRLKTEIADIPPLHVGVQRVASSGLYMDVLAAITGSGSLSAASREILSRYKLLGSRGEIRSESLAGGGEEGDGLASEMSQVDPASLAGKLSLISSLDKASAILPTLRDAGWLTPDASGRIEPFVVMAFHQSAAREISRQLEAEKIDHFLMMQQDSDTRRTEKKEGFQSGEKTAFVTSFGVGGVGLNLTRASRMVIANLPWTDTALAQGRDRIFRLGQTRPAEVMIMLLSASVDEATYFLLQNKGRANFKTIGVDKIKDGEIPAWARGSVMDNAKISASHQRKPKKSEEREAPKKPLRGFRREG